MQKSKTGKISIFNSLDVKLEFLTSRVKLTQFSVESNRVKLKIWATQLESSWKCEQLNSILIWVQNVNLKLNLMISLNWSENTIVSCLMFNNISFLFIQSLLNIASWCSISAISIDIVNFLWLSIVRLSRILWVIVFLANFSS